MATAKKKDTKGFVPDLDVLPTDPEHIVLQKQSISAVLGSRVKDNAGDVGFINHTPEKATGTFFNGGCDVYFDGDTTMTPIKVQFLHLCHAFQRIVTNALEGKVNVDKTTDIGGWATVMARYVQLHGKD
jgi:hypothetical protein